MLLLHVNGHAMTAVIQVPEFQQVAHASTSPHEGELRLEFPPEVSEHHVRSIDQHDSSQACQGLSMTPPRMIVSSHARIFSSSFN